MLLSAGRCRPRCCASHGCCAAAGSARPCHWWIAGSRMQSAAAQLQRAKKPLLPEQLRSAAAQPQALLSCRPTCRLLPLSPPPPLAAAHQPISNCMSSSGGPSGQAALPPLPAPVAPPPPLLAPRPPAAALAGAAGAAARPSRALSGMPCNGRGRWKVQCELQQGARCDCQAASCTKKPRPSPMKRTVRQQQLATATTSCSPAQAAVAAAHQLGGLRLWWPPLLGLGPNVNLKLELEGC